MLKLLRLLIIGHDHKWKSIAKANFSLTEDGKDVATGLRVIQQCEVCGKVVKRDLI